MGEAKILGKCEYCIYPVYDDQDYGKKFIENLELKTDIKNKQIFWDCEVVYWHKKCEDEEEVVNIEEYLSDA